MMGGERMGKSLEFWGGLPVKVEWTGTDRTGLTCKEN